ncbi:MAG: hypothetical protein R3Y09_00245 [Clostridia bacterium]
MDTNLAEKTQKRSMKEWILRLIILAVGVIIAHCGVVLFVISELGVDCFTIMVQGISRTIGTTVGIAHICTMAIMAIAILKTGYLKIGCLVCVFGSGTVIDLFTWLINGAVSGSSPMFVRVITMLLGLVIVSFGVSIMIKSDAGTGPQDVIAVILNDKFPKKKFGIFRMCTDTTYVIIGLILGGTFGIGTFAAAFLTGPLMQIFMPPVDKVISKILAK